MSEAEVGSLAGSQSLGRTRLIVGLGQGLALYLLYRAGDAHAWPATAPMLFAPLALVAFFVPPIIIEGLGAMTRRTLILWAAAAVIVLAGLGAYDRFRLWLSDYPSSPGGMPQEDMPSSALIFFAGAGLFIAHTLIAAGDAERKFIARYETYFDTAWKLGVQLALAAGFIGVFWGVLELGAQLFKLINLTFLSDLIEHAWFYIPATALAFAAALHLTDVRAKLVAGIRTVALVLLSWLLPLMALLAVGFVASLLFVGFEPLWKTRAATALLLASAAVLVVLVNAAWQNGAAEHTPPFVLRIGGTAAAFALVPLVAIAAYALFLRVSQYGWSEERIAAAASLAVAACYAFGYAASALRGSVLRWHWLEGIAQVNIATSFVVLAVLIALFSPIADPMRISVSSQMARLKSGAVPAAKFDYYYLRWEGGRFGHEALVELAANATGPDAALIRVKAKSALTFSFRFETVALTPEEIAAQITVYPKDRLLPQSLLRQDWGKNTNLYVPPCLTYNNSTCEAFVAELTGTPPDQFIFVYDNGDGANWDAAVLSEDKPGHWAVAGTLSLPHCKMALDALRAGQYAVVAPDPPKWRALEAGGSRFTVEPAAGSPPPCPK